MSEPHSATTPTLSGSLTALFAQVQPHEKRVVWLAFACHFVMMASYYILRPVRDTMATVFGSANLQYLFTFTLIGTLLFSPLVAWLASRIKLQHFLPGMFWFWLLCVLGFQSWFALAPQDRVLAGAYYLWFSISNLFMVSVFWSLMSDVFAPAQATRVFAAIAAGGSCGAIVGPLITRFAVSLVGISGLLLFAAAGFAIVIVMVHWLMREKSTLRRVDEHAQPSTLDHELGGSVWSGFVAMVRSPFLLRQGLFILLMTWIATIAYYMQTQIIELNFADVADRTRVIADIDLLVNITSALVLLFGLGRFVTRFGVTAGLMLNPLLMLAALIAVALHPSVLILQILQVLRRAGQYAIARPTREMCFTVVSQEERYKAKSVIDTVIYRFGDVSAAWMQAGLMTLGLGMAAITGLGLLAAGLWTGVAWSLGQHYERLRSEPRS